MIVETQPEEHFQEPARLFNADLILMFRHGLLLRYLL